MVLQFQPSTPVGMRLPIHLETASHTPLLNEHKKRCAESSMLRKQKMQVKL
jgi:hypothetical protein